MVHVEKSVVDFYWAGADLVNWSAIETSWYFPSEPAHLGGTHCTRVGQRQNTRPLLVYPEGESARAGYPTTAQPLTPAGLSGNFVKKVRFLPN